MTVQAAALKAGQHDIVRLLTWKLKDYLDLKGYLFHRLIVVQAGLDAARSAGDRYDEGQFLNELGLAYYSIGEHRRATDHYLQALAIARAIGDREGEGNALGNLGLAYATLGDTRRAIALYEQALDLDRAIGDRRGEGADLGNLGLAYYSLGETRRAIDLYAQRLAIAREIEDRRGEAIALGNLGNAYAAIGETPRAIELYEQQLVITRSIADRRSEAIGSWNLGEAYEMEGDLPAPSPTWNSASPADEIDRPRRRRQHRAGRASTAGAAGAGGVGTLCPYVRVVSAAKIFSTSYVHPPQIPPLACCSAAHNRVSSGRSGSGASSGCSPRRQHPRPPPPLHTRPHPAPPGPRSPSAPRGRRQSESSPPRSRPSGPPASASGPMWPMHAPVLTPLKRASVISATSFPHGRTLSADVTWYVSSIPQPSGPRPISTRMSPGRIGSCVNPLIAAIAPRSLVNTRAGPSLR